MRKILLLALSTFSFLAAFAQVDTEFWFAAPHICEHSRVTGGYHMVLFSYDKPAHIELSMPANSAFVTKTYDLNAYDYVDIEMAQDYDDAVANFEVPFDVVSQRGIHITSTSKIGGYYNHTGNNAEAYSLKNEALGTEFGVVSQTVFQIQSESETYEDAYSSAQIVATEDNTIVTITPVTGHPISPNCNATPIVVHLNRGETYAVRSCSKDPLYGVNGMRISSNKPIAVCSTDDSTQAGTGAAGLDLTGEQLVSLDFAGKRYAAIGQQNSWNSCSITALENGTTVTLSTGQVFNMQKDETQNISMATIQALYIESNKDVLVYQITGEDDEAAGTMLPALDCTGSRYVAYKRMPDSYMTVLNIVTKSSNINSIYINNSKVPSSQFYPVPGTGNAWYYASIQKSGTDDFLTVECKSGFIQLGVLDMKGTSLTDLKSCAYGYFSDYGTAHEYDEYATFAEGTTYTWKSHFLPGTTTPMVFTSAGVYTDNLIDKNGCDSICVLHLQSVPYPDNVVDVECVVPPMPSNFEMKEIFKVDGVHSMTTPMVADIDGDGLSEIICCKWPDVNKIFFSDGFLVIDGQTGDVIDTILTCQYPICGQPISIADVDGDGKCEIFLSDIDNYAYCYDYQGNLLWKTVFALDGTYIPLLGNLTDDNIPELLFGKYIFNPISGILIHEISFSSDGTGWGAPHGVGVAHRNFDPRAYHLGALSDVDHDGNLEYCAGNTIYKLNITNPNGQVGNSSSIYRQAESIASVHNYDGQTVVVDFDNDGIQDICVLGLPKDLALTSPQPEYDIYVWNSQTTQIIAHHEFLGVGEETADGTWTGQSIPYCGDLNGDGFVDLTFSAKGLAMYTYTYDATSPNHMRQVHNYAPFSETCGYTVFDFNMDGKSEIVYRGTHTLNIVDGTTLTPLSTPIEAFSGTVTEYPVVADVNKDGQAEIIICRGHIEWKSGVDRKEGIRGWVSVYGAANSGAWSSARSVWNQWAYNSININDDMSVPRYMYDVSIVYPNGTRPFNSFLAQKPIIDKQGDIFVPAADAAVSTCSQSVVNDSVVITLKYCNNGDANLVAPYEITTYQNEYRGTVVQVDTIKEGLAINECKTITIKVPSLSVCKAALDTAFIIAVNDDGHGIAQHGNQQAECDTTNNTYKILLPNDLRRDTAYLNVTISQGESYIFDGHTYATDTQDTATFVSAAGCDSVCVLDLKVIPYPDDVITPNCTTPLENNDWSIKTMWSSEDIISPLLIPLVGDVNNDGTPDILCFASNETYKTFGVDKIYVIDGISHNIIKQVNIGEKVSTETAGVYGIIKLNNAHTVVVVITTTQQLRAYDLSAANTPLLWETSVPYYNVNINFADFNNDGYPEIYIGSSIYDVETGTLLAYRGDINTGTSFTHGNKKSLGANRALSAPFAADIDKDGFVDLIVGNEIYKVTINNRNGLAGNSIDVYKVVTPPSGVPIDGHTQIADFNMDGYLDVLISKKASYIDDYVYYYVWDVHNNQISTSLNIYNEHGNVGGKNIPLITDIDNDGFLEIIIQSDAINNDGIDAYKYNYNSKTFVKMWNLPVDEDSYSNTMTMFDLDHNGIGELIITDQTSVRIVNGSGKSHKTGNDTIPVYEMSSFAFGECTIMQYPVIADVNNDGSAEIVAIGLQGSGHTHKGSLNIFTSAGKPWAPARSVWNQYMYNVFNVNSDLTIPTIHYDNAMTFADPDNPSIIRRPYNNFFQQSTTIDQYGRYVNKAADVNVSTATTTTYENDSIKIDISFCNQGDLQVNAPYCITAYKNAYRGSVLFVDTIKAILPIGDCLSHQVGFPISNVCSDKDINSIVIAVNDDGHGIAQHGNQQAECDTTNNSTSVSLPTDFRSDTTKYTPVICATELPYTFTPTGTIFPVGTTSGRTIIPETNKYGCDSIITIDLTVNPTLIGDTTATFCNGTSFIWHGTSYPTGGDYPYTYTSKVTGCDSIVTLHLTQLEPTDSVEVVTICAGGSHTWHGHIYTTNTTVTETIDNAVGCDSVCTLKLTVLPQLTGDTSATFCNGTPFMWHGTPYATGGDYPYTYTSKVAPYCDSIVTLHLTQLEPTDSVENVTLCYGESHVWHGQTFTTSTTISETIPNAAGCDSVCTLNLTILPALTGDTSATFCNGTPFIWHDTPYATGGDYQYTYTSKVAPYCDSIVTLHLTQLEPTDSIEVVTICYGGSHTWHGQTFTSSTTITETIPNAAGCDSVCTLNLTILPALTGDTSATFCSGKSITWHGTQYSIAGNYPYTYTSKVAPYCDSIVTLHLTQLEPTDSVENVTLCAGGSHTWHGQTFTTSTTITETIPNAAGCDSVCTLNLTILPALTGDTSATFCNGTPFIWHDTPYATGGDYQYTYTSKVAPYCDSIVTLHLTQLEPTDSVENITLCYGESHVWHGQTFTTSTTITETIPNAAGCDSVCTLNLTILPALTGDTSATFCNGKSFTWHGTQYSIAGHYPYTYISKVAPYCDSIVTLHLTQLEPTDSIEKVTLCYGESHVWHGQTFTTSTTITETIPNAAGCDSVCTLNLTILPALTGDTSATFCNGTPFIWHDTPYATGGDYQYTYTSKVAPYCDSIVTLHLTQLEPTDSIEVVTICYGGSHTWHGHTYTATTTTTETIDNAVGCDSVCTLKLTVLPAITGDTNMTVCDTLLPVTWRGQSVTGAGEYYHTATASNGCDSTITLHVTVETCLPPSLTCDTLEATLIVPDICADDDSMYIDITYTKGLPVSYNVTFGADAVAQGFQSSYTGNVRVTSSTTASISIPIPNDPTNRQVYPKPNVYSIDISILDTCDAYTTWRSQNFLIHYPSWLTLQRWNDVISLYNERYNGGYVFSQIRWFHEGTLLESRGDHDGYIYQRPTLVYGDAYWAELTRADDGVTITTCPIYPVPMTDSTKMDDVTDPYIIVTPTVVTPSNPTVTVKTNICGEYYVYYVDGHLLDKQNFCPKDNHTFTIDIDPCYVRTGLYILVFYGEEGTIKAVKLLVEP